MLLVRHGESYNNVILRDRKRGAITSEDYYRLRDVDSGLIPDGMREAEALGAFLSSSNETDSCPTLDYVLPIGALRVSPYQRTLQTMQPLARRTGMRPQVWTDCYETGGLFHVSGSSYRGISRGDMQDRFPSYDLPGDVTDAGWYQLEGAPGNTTKESAAEAKARAEGTADCLRILARSPDRPRGTLVLVSHQGQQNNLLRALLRCDDVVFRIPNTAMSCVDVLSDGRTVVHFLFRVDHILSPAHEG